MTGDGEPFADSECGPSRDPLGALVEFANLIRERGSVKAGTIVTTRVMDWVVFTRRGASMRANLGPLDQVEATFPADE